MTHEAITKLSHAVQYLAETRAQGIPRDLESVSVLRATAARVSNPFWDAVPCFDWTPEA